ncbi:winged helix-turn-helix transcriptional regulator [Mesorhizobium sp.]|uniref:winged helix-turn-helix transcriptional regulator n=1 Tax=Mesorhizobium sp. TaxID=1871066 RepID=UPI00345BEF15
MEKAGLISRRGRSHPQKTIYSLTEASIALVPLLAYMGGWGLRHTPASKELSVHAKILEDGGPAWTSGYRRTNRSLIFSAPCLARTISFSIWRGS